MKVSTYFWKLLVAIDQLVNTILGGSPDETISSRLGKRQRRGCKVCSFLCNILNMFEENHCEKSIEEDENRDSWGGTK